MHEIRCSIEGKVQNVAYRAYAQDVATKLDLRGWVRNIEGGSVEVVAQGNADILKEFVEYLNEGSSLSTVESVSVDWGVVKTLCEDFSIKYD